MACSILSSSALIFADHIYNDVYNHSDWVGTKKFGVHRPMGSSLSMNIDTVYTYIYCNTLLSCQHIRMGLRETILAE